MADFSASVDINNIIPEALKNENLGKEMVKAGQEVLERAIKNNAQKYKRTRAMANSIKSKTPTINKNGDIVGSVSFTGKDKNGMSNSQKALWLDYGTKNINGTAFVRNAVKSNENAVSHAMEQKFMQRTNNKE